MEIAITGASGFIGRRLTRMLTTRGDTVLRLGRRAEGPDSLAWDPMAGPPAWERTRTIGAIINLAGESVSQRWSRAVKERIRGSRVDGTRNLVAGIAKLQVPPRVLVSASAVGYYGDRGDELLSEAAPPNQGFLAEVSEEWEFAAREAEALGVRVVCIRIGLVLGREGGALRTMLPAFRWGAGAILGPGTQWMSWIHADDLSSMFLHAIDQPAISGSWNGVSPNPVTNKDFTRILASAVHRPALVRIPAWALRLGAGEMAQILLHSQRCVPEAPLAAGFRFAHPDLGEALRAVLT